MEVNKEEQEQGEWQRGELPMYQPRDREARPWSNDDNYEQTYQQQASELFNGNNYERNPPWHKEDRGNCERNHPWYKGDNYERDHPWHKGERNHPSYNRYHRQARPWHCNRYQQAPPWHKDEGRYQEQARPWHKGEGRYQEQARPWHKGINNYERNRQASLWHKRDNYEQSNQRQIQPWHSGNDSRYGEAQQWHGQKYHPRYRQVRPWQKGDKPHYRKSPYSRDYKQQRPRYQPGGQYGEQLRTEPWHEHEQACHSLEDK